MMAVTIKQETNYRKTKMKTLLHSTIAFIEDFYDTRTEEFFQTFCKKVNAQDFSEHIDRFKLMDLAGKKISDLDTDDLNTLYRTQGLSKRIISYEEFCELEVYEINNNFYRKLGYDTCLYSKEEIGNLDIYELEELSSFKTLFSEECISELNVHQLNDLYGETLYTDDCIREMDIDQLKRLYGEELYTQDTLPQAENTESVKALEHKLEQQEKELQAYHSNQIDLKKELEETRESLWKYMHKVEDLLTQLDAQETSHVHTQIELEKLKKKLLCFESIKASLKNLLND